MSHGKRRMAPGARGRSLFGCVDHLCSGSSRQKMACAGLGGGPALEGFTSRQSVDEFFEDTSAGV